MSLLVEFQIRGPPLRLPNAAAEVPDVTIEIERWRQSENGVLWYLWADGEELDRVTDAFESLSNVTDTAVVNSGPDRRFYRISMVPTVELPPEDLFLDGMLTSGYVRPDCLELTARVSGRDIVTHTWSYLRAHDIDVSLLRLSRPDGDDSDGRLTDRQFEALVTAYEMGYFEESSRVTQADVAAELDLSRSALSQRLRRAQHYLVEQQLDAAD